MGCRPPKIRSTVLMGEVCRWKRVILKTLRVFIQRAAEAVRSIGFTIYAPEVWSPEPLSHRVGRSAAGRFTRSYSRKPSTVPLIYDSKPGPGRFRKGLHLREI